jgi:HEPN domain-containing protein
MDEKYGRYVETEPYLLFKGAKNDIIDIHASLKDEEFSIEEKAYKICFNATRAAEKMFKGYIRYKNENIKIKMTHNLDYLIGIVAEIDENFKNIENDCDILDPYKSWTGYEPLLVIEKQEVIDVLKSLKNIYEYPLIKEARDILNNQHNFNTLPDNIMENVLTMITNNIDETGNGLDTHSAIPHCPEE